MFSNSYSSLYDSMHASRINDLNIKQMFHKVLGKEITEFSNILDFGCGTGTLLKFLEDEGVQNPIGFDISEDMLSVAASKLKRSKLFSDLELYDGPKMDLVISLFDVVNYQVSESLLSNFIAQIAGITSEFSTVVIESWYAGAHDSNRPKSISRNFVHGGEKLVRNVNLSFLPENQYNLAISIQDEKEQIVVSESHRLKAFFPEQLADRFSPFGFNSILIVDSETYRSINPKSFRFTIVLKRNI